MRNLNALAAASVSALAISSIGHADTVEFQMIPDASSADDMSPDGRYVVGSSNGFGPYIYDTITEEMQFLPSESSSAIAVSDNGDVVLGNIADADTGAPVAAIWTRASGVWTSIGFLPDAMQCPSLSSSYELSADGSIAVGLSWDGCSGRGFRWTQAGGMEELESLANGSNRASVVSADGSVIGGFAQGSFSRTPAIWDAAGNGTLLDPPNGDALGEVHGLSDDGTTLLGEWNGAATIWTGPTHDRAQLGDGSLLPGWAGVPTDIADNNTIVGFDFLQGNRRAWIQFDRNSPLINLATYVEANGGVLDGTPLQVPQAISTNGTKIVGHTSFVGAWIITITPDCSGDIAEPFGIVDTFDLLDLIAAWGTDGAGAGIADPTDVVDTFDLLELLASWGQCSPTGACCINSECSQLSSADCLAAGGAYLGDSVPCSVTACVSNDLCSEAIHITSDMTVVIGDNSQATPPVFGSNDPDLPFNSPSCHWLATPETAHSTVWYTFVAPPSGQITFELCGSAQPFTDSFLTLYLGECGSFNQVACDEDGCSDPSDFPYLSRIEATLIPNVQYYICVGNSGGWGGSLPGPFELTITRP